MKVIRSISATPQLITVRFLLAFSTILVTVSGVNAQAQDSRVLDSVTPMPNLYREDADAPKEIAEALKAASASNKRVLLVFGANWCYDCHVLDQALHQDEAGKIVVAGFLLIHVDIGEGEKNSDLVKLYKIPLEKGVPAVAVLESDGHLLYSSGQGEFEAARRMMKKDLIQFLQRWQKQDRPPQNRRRS